MLLKLFKNNKNSFISNSLRNMTEYSLANSFKLETYRTVLYYGLFHKVEILLQLPTLKVDDSSNLDSDLIVTEWVCYPDSYSE